VKVVVVGATGNCGSAVVRGLSSAGHEVIGVARRPPSPPPGGSVTWRAADVGIDDLDPIVEGADAVVHLAWMFQPTHRPEVTWQANAVGTRRVLESVGRQGVPAVVVASSVASYSPVLHDQPVDESWATDGASAAAYSREKAYVERTLDAFEQAHPDTRTVRLRPAFVFQRSAGTEQRRIFAGTLAPRQLFDRRFVPVVPVPAGLRFQAVHAQDLAAAYRAAVERTVSGAFNIAADDVIAREQLGEALDATTVSVPPGLVRAGIAGTWRARLIGAPAELYDALLRLPLMSTSRARDELGWAPQHSGLDALRAMLDGARSNWGSGTAPLQPDPVRSP
jgi:nucleoside-diphosphate-sugar epimerase